MLENISYKDQEINDILYRISYEVEGLRKDLYRVAGMLDKITEILQYHEARLNRLEK